MPVDCVAGLAQFVGNQLSADLLPGTHFARRSIDLCRVRKQRLLQPVIHDARVLVVVEGENRESDNPNEQERQR